MCVYVSADVHVCMCACLEVGLCIINVLYYQIYILTVPLDDCIQIYIGTWKLALVFHGVWTLQERDGRRTKLMKGRYWTIALLYIISVY